MSLSIADQHLSRPKVDSVRNPVASLGDEDDATTRRSGRVVNRGLDCRGIVGHTISRSAIGSALKIRREWVSGTLSEDGLREHGRRSDEKQKGGEEGSHKFNGGGKRIGRRRLLAGLDGVLPPCVDGTIAHLLLRRRGCRQRLPAIGLNLSADSEFSVHDSQICITALVSRELFVRPVLGIKMIAVARKDHRLHALQRKLGRPDLMQHVLVTIEGSASGVLKHQPRFPTQRILSVGSIESAIDTVRSGLCFGWLPKYRIESELKTGEIAPLNLTVGGTREVHLNLVCNDPSSIGHEVTTLVELLGMNREPEDI